MSFRVVGRRLSRSMRGGLGVAGGALLLMLFAAAGFAAVDSGGPSREEQGHESPDSKRVRELVENRKEHSRSFVRADGLVETEFSSAPLNYRGADGKWAPIDSSLVRDGEVLRNRAGGLDVELPDSLEGRQIRITDGGRSLSFGLSGAKGEAAVGKEKDTAVYEDAFDGVDVEYTAKAQAIKETLILDGKDSQSTFEFLLGLSSGLSPVLTDSGSVKIHDSGDRARFTIAAPWMVDAAGARSEAVSYGLGQKDGGWVLKLTADRKWLEASERRFPVKIDPTTYLEDDLICELVSGASADTSACDDGNIPFTLGKDSGGKKHRVIAHLPIEEEGLPKDSVVVSGELDMIYDTAGSSSDVDFDLYGLTQPFTTSATWNSRATSTSWATPGGAMLTDRETRRTLSNDAVSGWINIGAGRLFQGWLDGSIPNNGVLLKAADEDQTRVDTFSVLIGSVVTRPHLVGFGPGYQYASQDLTGGDLLDVNVANGNLTVSGIDGSVAPSGLPITRFWNSLDQDNENATFGAGWTPFAGGEVVLKVNWFDSTFYLQGPSGRVIYFHLKPDDTWVAKDGSATLTPDDNGMFVEFQNGDTKWFFPDGDYESGVPLAEIDNQTGQDYELSYTDDRLTEIEGSTSGTAVLDYDSNDELETVTIGSDEWSYDFDSNHRLTSVTNPENDTTTYTYDSNGLITDIETVGGEEVEIAWDDGRVTEISRHAETVDPDTTTYTYSGPTSPCNSTDHVAKTVVDPEDGDPVTYCSDGQQAVTDQFPAAGYAPCIVHPFTRMFRW